MQPEQQIFSVVSCNKCGMVLKPSALSDHLKKRHISNSLSENTDVIMKPVIAAATEPVIEHKAKRPRLDSNKSKEPKISSTHVIKSQNSAPVLTVSSPKTFLAATNSMAWHQKKPEVPNRLKVKLRKCQSGSWTVVN